MTPSASDSNAAADASGMILYDPPEPERIRREPAWQTHREDLRKEADQELKNGPFSVTFNDNTPTSDDPHDFQSIGIYWWPNPDTESGLPYVHHDGQINPETQGGDQHQLMRMFSCLHVLGPAWHFLRDPRYAEHAAEVLRVFFLNPETRMNPNLRHAQAIPGRNDGRALGMIVMTLRLPRLLESVQMLRSSEAWTKRDQAGFEAWLGDFLTWMRDPEFGGTVAQRPNNIGTWYDVAAVRIALMLDRRELARELLRKARTRRIDAHIAADGRQPHEMKRTISKTYSLSNLNGLVYLARMGQRVGVDLWRHQDPEDGAGIHTAVDFLIRHTLGPDPWPGEQIKSVGRNWTRLYTILRLAAEAYRQPSYAEAASQTLPMARKEESPVDTVRQLLLAHPPAEGDSRGGTPD